MEQQTQITQKQETELAQLLNVDDTMASALKSSIFPGAKDESIRLAWEYCKARKLDIMKKPCHIVHMNVKDSKTGKYGWRDVIMPGIAEARITATRTGQHGGLSPAKFGATILLKIGKTEHEVPEYCEITVFKIVNGERIGFSHTEYFEEACATTKEGELNSMWTKRKRGQLAKCAEAGALRKAFPDELGGEMTAEEMQDKAFGMPQEIKSAEIIRENIRDPFSAKNVLPAKQAEEQQNDKISIATLSKLQAAWVALGKSDEDITAACDYVGASSSHPPEVEDFENLTEDQGKKLDKVLKKQLDQGKTVKAAKKANLDPENPYQKKEEPEEELNLEGGVE